jgi:hypothetical protein
MTSPWRLLLIAGAVAGACAHAKTTDDGTEEQPPKEETQAETKAKPRSAPEPGSRAPELRPGDRDAMPVATKPEALLAPGAADKIRERLVDTGYLDEDAAPSAGAMRDSIQRFQRAQDLPATGVPDHATVERLGLDPDETFRRGTVKD